MTTIKSKPRKTSISRKVALKLVNKVLQESSLKFDVKKFRDKFFKAHHLNKNYEDMVYAMKWVLTELKIEDFSDELKIK